MLGLLHFKHGSLQPMGTVRQKNIVKKISKKFGELKIML